MTEGEDHAHRGAASVRETAAFAVFSISGAKARSKELAWGDREVQWRRKRGTARRGWLGNDE